MLNVPEAFIVFLPIAPLRTFLYKSSNLPTLFLKIYCFRQEEHKIKEAFFLLSLPTPTTPVSYVLFSIHWPIANFPTFLVKFHLPYTSKKNCS